MEIALRHIEERLGRRLESTEKQLLIILPYRALGERSSYIRILTLSPLEAAQHLKDMVYNKLKEKVENPELEAEKTPRKLQELIAHEIIYTSYVRGEATGRSENQTKTKPRTQTNATYSTTTKLTQYPIDN